MEREEVCELIDLLTLEMLHLIEQQIQCKVNIEKQAREGSILLAKSRYIQGPKTVTVAQLPTKDSDEFSALSQVVEKDADNLVGKEFELKMHKVDKSSGHVDPLNWFGVLVPRSLQLAKEKFQKTVELVVEGANVQRELDTVICYLSKLVHMKKDFNKNSTVMYFLRVPFSFLTGEDFPKLQQIVYNI